jgi:hypothetical protein
VALQLGLVWPDEHNRTEDAVRVIKGSIVVSLAKTLMVWITLTRFDVVSTTAVGGVGAVTLGVIVELTNWFRLSFA